MLSDGHRPAYSAGLAGSIFLDRFFGLKCTNMLSLKYCQASFPSRFTIQCAKHEWLSAADNLLTWRVTTFPVFFKPSDIKFFQ